MNLPTFFRPGWVKYGWLFVLAACAGAGGFYLARKGPEERLDIPPQRADGGETSAEIKSRTHRFPLTARDAKDSIEAPDLAVDEAGRIFMTWASKTGEAERTVFLTRSSDAGRTFDAPRAISKGGV